MKNIKPLFYLDAGKAMHFCLQEATLSAIVITIYMMLTDWVDENITKQPMTKWQKYCMTMVVMFVASFVSILLILIIFGYDCCHHDGKKK